MESALITPDSFYGRLHADEPYDFSIRGIRYKSVTHFIYASMMPDIVAANGIRNELSADLARKKALAILYGKKSKTGRKLAFAAERIIRSALKEGYLAKFRTGAFNQKLLETGNEMLVYSLYEDTFLPGDTTVLGVNKDLNGQNFLGKILQEVREAVVKYKAQDPLQVIADRYTQIYLRRQYLIDELRNGILPFDYSYAYFEKLRSPFFSPDQRMAFYKSYLMKKEKYYAEMDSLQFYSLLKLLKQEKISRFEFDIELSRLLSKPKNKFIAKIRRVLQNYDFSLSARQEEINKLLNQKHFSERDILTFRSLFNLNPDEKVLFLDVTQLLEKKVTNEDIVKFSDQFSFSSKEKELFLTEFDKLYQKRKSAGKISDEEVLTLTRKLPISEDEKLLFLKEELNSLEQLAKKNTSLLEEFISTQEAPSIQIPQIQLLFERYEKKSISDVNLVQELKELKVPYEKIANLIQKLRSDVYQPEKAADYKDVKQFYQAVVETSEHVNLDQAIETHYQALREENGKLLSQILSEAKGVIDVFERKPSGDILNNLIMSMFRNYRADPTNYQPHLYHFLQNLLESVDPELQVYRHYLQKFDFSTSVSESKINSDILFQLEQFHQKGFIDQTSDLTEIADLIEEFEQGNTNWIEREYDLALHKYAILEQTLFEKGIDMKTLVLSLGRDKIIQDYATFAVGDKSSLKKFLQETNITLPLIESIGFRKLTSLREEVYQHFKTNYGTIPFTFKEKVVEIFKTQKHNLQMNINFRKFIPQVEDGLEKMMAKQDTFLPVEPEETYGNQALLENYQPVEPKGACSEEKEEVCPLGGWDDPEERESEKYMESELEAEEVLEDTFDLEAFFDEKFNFEEEEPGKENLAIKGKIPPSAIRIGNELSFPYEWMAPFHLTPIIIDDVSYPSVGHYVIAKLATLHPVWKNLPRTKLDLGQKQIEAPTLRKWLQKNPNETGSGFGWKLNLDRYRPVSELIRMLPQRMQENIQNLFVRMAQIGFSRKMAGSPYREILFSTLPYPIEYVDPDGLNRENSKIVANLLEKIRSTIKDVILPEKRKGVFYDRKHFPHISEFMYNRARILTHALLAFAKYKISHPKLLEYHNAPAITFDDMNFTIKKLLLSCYTCTYLDDLENPPDHFKFDVNNLIVSIAKNYLPRTAMQNVNDAAMKEVIVKFAEQKDVQSLEKTYFYDLQEIIRYYWSHVNQMVYSIVPKLDDKLFFTNYTKLIEDAHNADLGTKTEVAVNAVINLLAILKTYIHADCSTADLDLIRNLILRPQTQYRIQVVYQTRKGYDYGKETFFPEEENYQKYGFVDKLHQLYRKELPLKTLKQFGGLIREILLFPETNQQDFVEFTVRLKFFAQPD